MKVEFKNVSHKRKNFRLQNITFDIREGYITALIGKNGAGKTTLFHLLLDKEAKYEGQILADGTEWRENQAERLNQIGFVSDEQKFFMERTALENVEMLQWLYEEFSIDEFKNYMEQMELSVQKRLTDMSRGEYIKYQLAFAIAHRTQLYLLDEATAGMDPIFKKEFFQMLHELLVDEHCAVFMSTHLQDEVTRHMDYVIQMEQGRIISEYEVGAKYE